MKKSVEGFIFLDEAVINALDLFSKEKIPKLDVGGFKRPLVVGSGNAAVTGKMIFKDNDAVFADEGNYKSKIKNIKVDGAVLISASGKKHAPIIAKDLKKKKIRTILLTNNSEAPASKFVSKSYVFLKNPEPYTYNTSTYLGMLLSKTKESPRKILNQLKKVKKKIPRNLKKYDSYYFLIPENLELSKEMFLTKFDELFGSRVSGRVFTFEQTKHAKTVVSSDRELFVNFGGSNKIFGKKRIDIPLSKNADFGEIIAVIYFFVGYIQRQNPQYFKQNIEKYTKEASNIFGQEIKAFVK